MMDFDGTDYQTVVTSHALDSTKHFSNNETHVNIAFGLFDVLRNRPFLTEYYDLVIRWSAKISYRNSSFYSESVEHLTLHKCTREDMEN